MLSVLQNMGCSVQVCDDFGRTPLHDACWTCIPSFDTVSAILDSDIRLLKVVDCRGVSPLSYTRREHWSAWIQYLERFRDKYWPSRDLLKDGVEADPVLTKELPHSNPLPDPEGVASLKLAELVAGGHLDTDKVLKKILESKNEKGTKDEAEVDMVPQVTEDRPSSNGECVPNNLNVELGT